jgi:hypothetical protein
VRRRFGTAGVALTRSALATLLVFAAVHREAVADQSVEAEQLLQEGKASASGGELHVQPMAAFGHDWSGGAQLLWTAPAPGAVLDLQFQAPKNSRWALDLELTLAPDYGKIQLEVDGKSVIEQIETFSPAPGGKVKPEMLNRVLKWNGYATTVRKGAAFGLPHVVLEGGAHRLSILVFDKDPQSTGYYVGVDRLVFHRLPPGRTN